MELDLGNWRHCRVPYQQRKNDDDTYGDQLKEGGRCRQSTCELSYGTLSSQSEIKRI